MLFWDHSKDCLLFLLAHLYIRIVLCWDALNRSWSALSVFWWGCFFPLACSLILRILARLVCCITVFLLVLFRRFKAKKVRVLYRWDLLYHYKVVLNQYIDTEHLWFGPFCNKLEPLSLERQFFDIDDFSERLIDVFESLAIEILSPKSNKLLPQ